MPCGNGEMLFCELPDGTRGTVPSWMTDAAACAVLTIGTPVVAITALQELRLLLDVLSRGSDLTEVSGKGGARNATTATAGGRISCG